LQPLTYWWAFLAYQDEIDRTQWYMGVVVGSREAFYAFIVLVAVVCRPVFLLVDSKAMLRPIPTVTDEEQLQEVEYRWGKLGRIRSSLGEACCVDLLELIIYVLLPEKFVMYCLSASQLRYRRLIYLGNVFLLPLLFIAWDAFGVAALVAAGISGKAPPALMVGYSVSAAAMALGAFLVVGQCCCCARKRCCWILSCGLSCKTISRCFGFAGGARF
jgi:hypothetical protein